MSHDPLHVMPLVVPGYAILRELGGGGMSRVFVAREEALGREVVVKVLASELAESLSVARFAREIRLAAALQEPHIVPVLAAGTTASGLPYYAMPYVRGESLRARIDAGSIPPREALSILRDVALALDHAHGQHVVHRDIKPENILLSSGTAVVTDFGIAKAITAARAEGRSTAAPGASVLTSLGTSLGTPAYMAPEQAAGDPDVDHRADLYAWGIVAWELLGGRHPFADRRSAARLIAAHISEQPARLSGVPAALATLVARCVEKDPALRPQSAHEIIEAVDALHAGAATSAEHSLPRSPLLSPRKLSWKHAAMLLPLVAVIAAVAVWQGSRDTAGAAATSTRSVGVLPFVTYGGDSTEDYFSEGVSQEIAHALGRMPGLRIALHTPAGPEQGRAGNDLRALARQLDVETLLLGTVQRSGERLRVSARLVDAATGFNIWSDRFDRSTEDVFALQDDIARSIAAGLQLTLAPGGRDSLVRAGTDDPEAHRLYLQGMFAWNRRGASNLYRSIELFEQALERDPQFARAWAGLALAKAILVTWDVVDVPTTLAAATDAASRALAIDSTTADAWVAIAEARSSLWRNTAASAAFERAIALDPNNATAHQWYGEHLGRLGHHDEGLAHIRTAQQLAPLSLVVNVQEGRLMLQARRYERAAAALLHVLALDSTYLTAHALLGATLLQQGKHPEAIASLRRAVDADRFVRTPTLAFLANAYTTAGLRDSAQAILRTLEERRRRGEPVSYAGLALVLQGLGEHDRALAMLDTAVQRFDGMLGMQVQEPVFDPFRASERGRAILSTVVGP